MHWSSKTWIPWTRTPADHRSSNQLTTGTKLMSRGNDSLRAFSLPPPPSFRRITAILLIYIPRLAPVSLFLLGFEPPTFHHKGWVSNYLTTRHVDKEQHTVLFPNTQSIIMPWRPKQLDVRSALDNRQFHYYCVIPPPPCYHFEIRIHHQPSRSKVVRDRVMLW